MAHKSFNSPVGPLTLFEENETIVALEWGQANGKEKQEKNNLLEEACNQLNGYFDAKLKRFDLPLNPSGTKFQKRVWIWLRCIPFGQTKTYKNGANVLKSGPRAVGNACARNPIPLIIPCHRILNTSGSLGGFSAFNGVTTKKDLLYLEGSLDF
jgi:methylated-DNA-[protein]-cysteine S-methyltransferase